jgi:hypothetical protein
MLCARDLGMVLNYEVRSIPQKVMSDASEDEFFISFLSRIAMPKFGIKRTKMGRL